MALRDKQLSEIGLADVLKKRRLEQALNAKEFAVLAGISYSTARQWFQSPGFPVFRGVVFWQDFVEWRTLQIGLKTASVPRLASQPKPVTDTSLPPKAVKILLAA